MTARRDWTPEEDHILAEMTRAGKSCKAIAEHIPHRTTGMVSKRRLRLGLRALESQWTEVRVKRLKDMWRRGLSGTAIARTLGGVTRSAVIGKIHRLKIEGEFATHRRDVTAEVTIPAPGLKPVIRMVDDRVEVVSAPGVELYQEESS